MSHRTQDFILWGFHPAYGNVVMKLCDYARQEQQQRERDGWTCACYKRGEEPKELRIMAEKKGLLRL